MEYPTQIKGYTLTNLEKVRRVLEGVPSRTGAMVGGIIKEDGTYDEDELLAMYDRIGGGITKNGDTVQMGSFYDFRNKRPHEKAKVMLEFRVNGSLVVVPAEEEAPAIVKAARIVAEAGKKAAKKK